LTWPRLEAVITLDETSRCVDTEGCVGGGICDASVAFEQFGRCFDVTDLARCKEFIDDVAWCKTARIWRPRRDGHSDKRDCNRRDHNAGDLKNKPAWQLACADGGGHGSSLRRDQPMPGGYDAWLRCNRLGSFPVMRRVPPGATSGDYPRPAKLDSSESDLLP